MDNNKIVYRITVNQRNFHAPSPPQRLNGASYDACNNWVEMQAPGHRLAYSIIPIMNAKNNNGERPQYVIADGDRLDAKDVEFINIEEDMQGRDLLTFRYKDKIYQSYIFRS